MKRFALAATCALLAITGSARADVMAYIGYQSGAFGTIDLNTGVVTPIIPNIGINPAGFGEIGGVLYTGNYGGGTLYTVNTTTGLLTPVGTDASIHYHDFGSTPTGLYEADGNLSLYAINPSNGTATDVGAFNGVTFSSFRALSTNSSTLYYASNNTLYDVTNTPNPATAIGTFSGGGVVMTALLLDAGTLYGADESGNFYTIDTGTGAATFLSYNVGGAVWALAPILSSPPATVPEPITLSLFGAGLAGAVAMRRRKKAA